jgi:hypothetical protein
LRQVTRCKRQTEVNARRIALRRMCECRTGREEWRDERPGERRHPERALRETCDDVVHHAPVTISR